MKRTTILRIGLSSLIGMMFTLSGCSLIGGKATPTPPATATVTRGDLATYITASGNLSYPDTQDVRFNIGGTVSDVLVQAGDTVKQGDVLVKLDDSDIQNTIKTDQINVKNQQIAMEKVVDQYKQLIYPYSYKTFAVDIPTAIPSLQEAERKINDAMEKLSQADAGEETAAAASDLLLATRDFDNALNQLTLGLGEDVFQRGTTGSLTNTSYWDLHAAQLNINSTQAALNQANNDLATAQANLNDTLVKAPFDGLVTDVPVEVGAIVNNGNVAVSLTNPNNLEADVLVNEVDIFSVRINGTATVSVDAANGFSVPATVTYIEPTATISSGVVNYSVKVTLNQPGTGNANQTAATPNPNRTRIPGALSASPTISFTSLREGLSVSVNILKSLDKNVLLVPNRALVRQGTTTIVQIVNVDGTIENRTVQTGAADNRNTEVTQGLTEGDKVVVPNTATRTATPAAGGGGGLFGGVRAPLAVPRR